MNNNFIELTNEQLLDIDGGRNWLKITGGALICVGAIMSAPVTGGLGTGLGVIGGIGCIIDGL